MEPSDKIFGSPCTTTSSAVPSFSDVAASRLFSNPFAAVTTTTTAVASLGSTVFGQSHVFPSRSDSAISSTSYPFAGFNYSAPSFPSQNPTFSFAAPGGPSFKSIAQSKDSEVKLLFGKPVHDESKKEQSEQKEQTPQPSQLEPRRRWNAKPGH